MYGPEDKLQSPGIHSRQHCKCCIMKHSLAFIIQVPWGSRKAVFMEKKKSLVFLSLAASFILGILSMSMLAASAQFELQIHEPRVFSNDALPTGQETIWSCITFGRYPSAEVVRSSWDSVDSYALRDGDVIRDDELYLRLNEAEWSGNRLTLDGQNYIRINRTDAVTAAADREQHYRWDDPDEWHYFAEQPIK